MLNPYGYFSTGLRERSRKMKLDKILTWCIDLLIVAFALCVSIRGFDGEAFGRGLSVLGAGVVTYWMMRGVMYLE